MDSTQVVVGIPTYNNRNTIGTTLEMLQEQTRPPDRIICCDKSSDNTREAIQAYQKEESETTIEVLTQVRDGVADAYNEILEHIEADYDIFATIQTNLSVDEGWLEGHLEIHKSRPEVDMVTGCGRNTKPTEGEVTPDDAPYYIGRNFSVKSGTLDQIDGWDRNFLRGEDWDMRIRLAGAGTRVYTSAELQHDWQKSDPYITYSKAKRKPTSVSFLSKYGTWYLRFHPSHVVADSLSFASILSVIGTVALLPVAPALSVGSAFIFSLSILSYWIGHITLIGGANDNKIIGPIRKQLLTGVAVFHAFNRVWRTDINWKMSGFDPENTPRYKF